MLHNRHFAVWLGCAAAVITTVALAAGPPTITNATHYAIVAVQARPAGGHAWKSDLLGKATIGVGKSMRLPLSSNGSCRYDLFVTFDDGHKVLRPNLYLCGKKPARISDTP